MEAYRDQYATLFNNGRNVVVLGISQDADTTLISWFRELQTPIMVMSDLDIGMNDWITDPFEWDDAKVHDRGKVLSAEQLEAFKTVKGQPWGRYQDVDGDAIPYRTLPGTHPTMGAFFTRGTSHDENARYTEDGTIHQRVIERIRTSAETNAWT